MGIEDDLRAVVRASMKAQQREELKKRLEKAWSEVASERHSRIARHTSAPNASSSENARYM